MFSFYAGGKAQARSLISEPPGKFPQAGGIFCFSAIDLSSINQAGDKIARSRMEQCEFW